MSQRGYDIADDFMYFKAGAYNGSNDEDGGLPDDFSQVTSIILRRLIIGTLAIIVLVRCVGLHKYLVIPIIICCNNLSVTGLYRLPKRIKN